MTERVNPWARHGVGARFRNAELKHLDKKYFGDVLDYAKHAERYLAEGRGLLLSGPPGIGKTYSIVALMKYLKVTLASRFDFLIVTAPGLFDMLDQRDNKWLRIFESTRGLVINDLGKEDRSREWLQQGVTSKLGRVMRARHEEQLPVFITTNLPLEAPKQQKLMSTFQNVYGDALWSLIYDMTQFRVEIQAPDRRKNETEPE